MAGIDSIIIQSFDELFRGSIISVLNAIVPALTVSTNLFSTGSYAAWESVLFISESLVSIALLLVAYSLFTGVPLRGKVGTTRMISRLAAVIVLMPFTLYIAQLVLDLNDAMVSYVLPYGELASYSSHVVSKLGGYSLGAFMVIGIVSLLLYLVLIVRTLLVFFTASLLPLALLCDVFAPARAFSRKLLSLFAEMAFLPFFMSVGLKIGIATSYSTFSSLQVPSLVIAGTYLLPLLVPFIISPAGARVMQYFGMPAIGAVFTAASVAAAGAASYAAGFLTFPFRPALQAMGKAPVHTGYARSFRHPALRGAAVMYGAGRAHGGMLLNGVAGGAFRLSTVRTVSGRSGSSPFSSGRTSGSSGKAGPHKIFVEVSRDE